MKRTVAFFDAKPYDKQVFDAHNRTYDIRYFDSKLSRETASLAAGCDGVCAFVNDTIDAGVIDALHALGVRVLAMRCAGYSNVDFKAAYGKINVLRVPAYSPYAVAEHAMGLLLTVNRKLNKAYNRTREFNFSLVGLTGVDLFGKRPASSGRGESVVCFPRSARASACMCSHTTNSHPKASITWRLTSFLRAAT